MDQKVVVPINSYANYIDAVTRMSLLRDALTEFPEYNWPKIIRVILQIPREDENES